MQENTETTTENSSELAIESAAADTLPGKSFAEEALEEVGEELPPFPKAAKKPRVKHPPFPVQPNTEPLWVPVTEPKFRQYYSDQDNPNQRSKSGYNYWNSLTTAQKERLDAYVYRDWPVLKPLPEDSKEYKYIDKILGVEPIKDDNDLLDKYGSGDYHIFLNQELSAAVAAQLKQPVKRTLCTIYVRGRRDLQSRPPIDKRVSDIDQVDLTDPANKSYLEFLRMRGKLPEQQSKDKAEAEMATIQAVEKMADTNKELMHEVITMAKESGRRDPPAPARTPDTDAIIKATDHAMSIVREAATKSISEQKDPLEMALRLVEVMRPETGAAVAVTPIVDTAAQEEVRELRRQVADLHTAQLNSMQEQLREMSARLATPAVAAVPSGGPFGSIKEGITAFKEMKNLVDSVSGKADSGDGDAAPGGPAWLKTAAAIAPHASSVMGTVRDMWAMWQMSQMRGQGAPQPGQQQPPAPQPFAQPPAATPGPQLVPPPAALPNPLGPPNYGLPEQAATIFSQIRVPLLNHLEAYAGGDEDCNGKNFADWFLFGFGEEAFKSATVNGEDLLTQALYAYPPIAEWIPKTGIDDVKFRQFVKDFVTFKVEEAEEEPVEDDGGDDQEPVMEPAGGAA